jgi:hypothetical protein
MIEPVIFKLDDVQWDEIRRTVHAGLGLDIDLTLRTRIEGVAAIHIQARDLPELRARRDDIEKEWKRAVGRLTYFRSEVDVRNARNASARRYIKACAKVLEITEADLAEQKRKLDNLIASLPAPSSRRPTSGRDLFWDALLSIWCELGGRESGVDAANFLIAVSAPVFNAMPRHVRHALPQFNSVIEWLRVRARKLVRRRIAA